MKINIKNDYTRTPSARTEEEGDYSAVRFRKTILAPKIKEAIAKNCKIDIVLDGTAGFGTSFLEEAFGGLIREEGLSISEIRGVINIISIEEPYLIDDINSYLEDASNETA